MWKLKSAHVLILIRIHVYHSLSFSYNLSLLSFQLYYYYYYYYYLIYNTTVFPRILPAGTIFFAHYEAAGTIQGREQIKGGDYCAQTSFVWHI